jgi:hypothetical protein
MPLPADVHEIVVSGGTIDIALTHDFDFDPIRPGAASDSGSITITATSAGDTVATLVIDGADQAFAAGDTLRESLVFQPSAIQDVLQFEFTIDSPAGDNTTIDTTDEFEVEISSEGVEVSEATVGVASVPITGTEVELDLSGIDFEGITEGTLVMEISNPFSVTGTLTLSVEPEGGAGPIEKNVALVQGTTTTEVTFDEAEITQMAGEVNTVTIDGVLNAVGGEVTVRPDMVIGVEMRLRATVEVGGSGDNSGS